MIVLVWAVLIVTSFLIASNQAFLNAPIPAHAMSSYSISAERRTESDRMTHGSNDNRPSVDTKFDDDDSDKNTFLLLDYNEEISEMNVEKGITANGSYFVIVNSKTDKSLDPWSVVWYIGSFGALVVFFLIISCSEWCCRRAAGRPLSVPYASRQRSEMMNSRGVAETPPPPYHLFAPPPYDSVNVYGNIVDTTSEKLDIYVISVPTHRPMVQAPA